LDNDTGKSKTSNPLNQLTIQEITSRKTILDNGKLNELKNRANLSVAKRRLLESEELTALERLTARWRLMSRATQPIISILRLLSYLFVCKHVHFSASLQMSYFADLLGN
jgi:hypothetical protein